jgi:hypothetical protein
MSAGFFLLHLMTLTEKYYIMATTEIEIALKRELTVLYKLHVYEDSSVSQAPSKKNY